MRVFREGVRPLEGLLVDGLRWGLGVGATAPLLVCVVAGVLAGSPGLVLLGFLFGLVGAVVGSISGGVIGLVAGVLFEAWSLARTPALVVAIGTVAPVFIGLCALPGGLDGVVGQGSGTALAVLAAGPLVADVLHRARGLQVERDAAAATPRIAARQGGGR